MAQILDDDVFALAAVSSVRWMPKQPDAETSSCQVGGHHDLLVDGTAGPH